MPNLYQKQHKTQPEVEIMHIIEASDEHHK